MHTKNACSDKTMIRHGMRTLSVGGGEVLISQARSSCDNDPDADACRQT